MKDSLGNKIATILVVDDVSNNLVLISELLKNESYRILISNNGESTIKIAVREKPDLILLDVKMPGIDGYETCRRLKESVAKDIPVIFLSAMTDTSDKTKGFRCGAIDYIAKPIDPKELLIRVKVHLRSFKATTLLSLENKKQQRLLEFSDLTNRIGNILRDGLDETRVLPCVTKELAQSLDLAICQIEIYDSTRKEATIEYEYITDETFLKNLGSSRKIIGNLEKSPKTTVKKTAEIEKISELKGKKYTKIACPIFDDQGIIGNLWGVKKYQSTFSKAETCLMQEVAIQCAIVVHQARLYQASVKQREELERLNKLKDNFLKSVSHELKTPMASIYLAVQTIETLLAKQDKTKDSIVLDRVISIFHESCTRQKELVDDLLTLCYSDSKLEGTISESINFNTWLIDLIEPFILKVKDQNQELFLTLTKEDTFISTQPMVLERIVQEFLYNALKYTPRDETITVASEVIGSEISFCVINTGVEISEDEQKLIFDQFYRIPNNDPWQYGGTGLGLAIVKKLAVLLNAKVDLISKDLQTSFCIRLMGSETRSDQEEKNE